MFRNKIYVSVLSATLISGLATAEPEVTGKITYERADYTNTRSALGVNDALGSANARGKDTFKSETSARIYVDGALEDEAGSTYHLELQAFRDGKAVNTYDSNESYTQRDALREAYVDTSYDDWLIRAGKQQVVWGTADGMKLLDNINPTDFSEMAQNQMEDSRIPVWMVNAEKSLDDGGNFQFIVSQPKENIFAGLNRGISTATRSNGAVTSLTASPDTAATGQDEGHPFILKGVDSITGKSNGFVNIVPDLGSVATMFGMAFGPNGYPIGLNPSNHGAMNYFQVGSFNTTGYTLAQFNGSYKKMLAVAGYTDGTGVEDATLGYGGSAATYDGFEDLIFGTTAFWTTKSDGTTVAKSDANAGTYFTGQAALSGFAGLLPLSNLQNTDSATNSVFEYMDRTPFSTFDAFVGAKSRYKFSMPEDSDVDLSMRYKNTTQDGVNYSFNYSYAYDKNPIINLNWEDSSGNRLYVCRNAISGVTTSKYLTLNTAANCGGSAGTNSATGSAATLVFDQEVKRVHNIGGSFDMAVETETLGPVVIRGEAVYQKDTYSPVMDRGALSIGDLPAALTMRKGDRFKYVLGADVTAMTNMMVSLQFIQDRNLDHIDSKVDWDGSTTCTTQTNCGVYTTDYATMHLTNGFNKAEKDKNFYSLYLSKPYGESGQHRWNNIFIYEENGGKWNRLDTEYTIDDNTVATIEYNKYWGDANTQFGQLEKASNVQVGLKYTF